MKRVNAYLVIAGAYAVACVAGYLVFYGLCDAGSGAAEIIWALLAADVVMTVIVWGFGLLFNNSSFYDPYWSLIPWLMILAVMLRFSLLGAGNIVFLGVFGIWSFRLTLNWAYTCENIKTQDWRYVMYKENNKPFMWHLINFGGIHMVPTLLVFLGLVPAVIFVLANTGVSFMLLLGCAVMLLGTALEFFADTQMHQFRKDPSNIGKVIDTGLWSVSRHPNYLGEITVWLGVFLPMLSFNAEGFYWVAGFFMMVLLFMCVSIPLAEKRQTAKRPDYADYKKRVSKLLPLPRKKAE